MTWLERAYMRMLRWLRGEHHLCYECRGHKVVWDQPCVTCVGTGSA